MRTFLTYDETVVDRPHLIVLDAWHPEGEVIAEAYEGLPFEGQPLLLDLGASHDGSTARLLPQSPVLSCSRGT